MSAVHVLGVPTRVRVAGWCRRVPSGGLAA